MRSPKRVEMNRDRKVTRVSFDLQWLGMVQEYKLTLTVALRSTLLSCVMGCKIEFQNPFY
jgi:hypothetical protein